MRRLRDAVTALGPLAKAGGRYRLTPAAERYLAREPRPLPEQRPADSQGRVRRGGRVSEASAAPFLD
jgi:hypothetical protein